MKLLWKFIDISNQSGIHRLFYKLVFFPSFVDASDVYDGVGSRCTTRRFDTTLRSDRHTCLRFIFLCSGPLRPALLAASTRTVQRGHLQAPCGAPGPRTDAPRARRRGALTPPPCRLPRCLNRDALRARVWGVWAPCVSGPHSICPALSRHGCQPRSALSHTATCVTVTPSTDRGPSQSPSQPEPVNVTPQKRGDSPGV